MKVVLLKDVKGLGKKHEIKTVADGHALNFLIPKGEVEVATTKSLSRVEEIKKLEVAEKKIQEDLLAKNLKSIHDTEVEIKLDANEKGHLFAGLHPEEISKLVKASSRLDISPEFINLPKPIKEIGTHEIDVKVQGKSATFKLIIKAK